MADTAGTRFDRLVDVMRTLRGPQGCPWDREQTLSSLRPFVLEETYELLDALDRNDMSALCEELGDFLFEAVFLTQIAEESGHFSIGDAVQAIVDKLVRRHPHVFTQDGQPRAGGSDVLTSAAVVQKWETLKANERQAAGSSEQSVLSGVPRTLPSLLRAYELSSRAATVGFDWPRTTDVLEKLDEEVAELREMVDQEPRDAKRVEEEMGDLLFSIVNVARKLGIEPEAALRVANDKFQTRFEGMERALAHMGQSWRDLTLDDLEAAWQSQKQATKHTKARSGHFTNDSTKQATKHTKARNRDSTKE